MYEQEEWKSICKSSRNGSTKMEIYQQEKCISKRNGGNVNVPTRGNVSAETVNVSIRMEMYQQEEWK